MSDPEITPDAGQARAERTNSRSRLTRRESVILVGQVAVLVGLGGAISLLGPKTRLLRPPGALAEKDFLALCIKCQKCQQVCPTGVIGPVLVTEDAVSAGTARLNFRLGYCNLCMDCIPVCPTGALQPTERDAVRLGIAEVDRERCVAWVWKGCTRCYDECPFDAIVLDSQRRPIVDASTCNGCGLCEYICPSASLRAYTRASGKGIVVVPLNV